MAGKYIDICINNIQVGRLTEDLIEKCKEKLFIDNIEDLFLYVISLYMDKDYKDINTALNEALDKKAELYIGDHIEVYDTICDMIFPVFMDISREINEICKNCSRYTDQFCTYNLCRVHPFAKGCGIFEERTKDNSEEKVVNFVEKLLT